jgi:hypothetical protein
MDPRSYGCNPKRVKYREVKEKGRRIPSRPPLTGPPGKGHRGQTVRRWRAHLQGERAHQRMDRRRCHLRPLEAAVCSRARVVEGGGRRGKGKEEGHLTVVRVGRRRRRVARAPRSRRHARARQRREGGRNDLGLGRNGAGAGFVQSDLSARS